MATATTTNPADALAALVAAGIARYQTSYAPPLADVADVEPEPNTSGVAEARQIQLCLSCPLSDCVGVESSACPIRREQLRVWRDRRRA